MNETKDALCISQTLYSQDSYIHYCFLLLAGPKVFLATRGKRHLVQNDHHIFQEMKEVIVCWSFISIITLLYMLF